MTRRTILISLLAVAASGVFANPSFNYTIEPSGLDGSVYREATSRFQLSSSDTSFSLVDTGTQRVLGTTPSKGKPTIIVATGVIRKEALSEREAAGYLADTRFLTMDSPEIRGVMEKLPHAPDPVASVERFVYGHITDKTIGIPLIPADQIYRTRRGDCTEHSVLAVALLRSLGIPARALVGVYLADNFNGKNDVFVYHMWVEAYMKGRWRLTDATRPGKTAANRYIAFAYHNLKTDAPLPYLRAISAIQDLTIRYCAGGSCKMPNDQVTAPAPFCILAHESRSDTVLLSTYRSSVESVSTQK